MASICNYCQDFALALLEPHHYDHQPSLQALKTSARSCTLCNLFWHCITLSCSSESVETHLQGRVYGREEDTDTSIRLWCSLRPYQFRRNPYEAGNYQEVNSIWVYSGRDMDVETESLKSTQVYGFVRLYPKFDTAAENIFPAREIGPSPLSESAVSMVKQSVLRCQKEHQCGYGNVAPLPTRVLDLRPMAEGKGPLLVDTKGAQGAYVALSYCWGRNQTYKTTADRVHGFQTTGIQYDKMSKTAQQAIQVTRMLEIDYIWIDAFCIIQGGEGDNSLAIRDFGKEGLKMASYYGNATVGIIAASSSDSTAGFLEPRPEELAQPFPLEFALPKAQNVAVGTLYAGLRPKYTIGPIEQRAWTLQEDALSPRAIIFGTSQNAYRCIRGTIWEDGSTSSTTTVANAFKSVQQSCVDSATTLRQWYTTLQKYSRRSRGVAEDKLTAIAGIAQASYEQVGGNYIFGLWDRDLVRGLLWRHGWFTGDAVPLPPLRAATEYAAPSWSWASYDGPMVCPFSNARQEKDVLAPGKVKAEVSLDVPSTAVNFDPIRAHLPLDTYSLRIKGVIKAAICAAQGSMEEYFTYSAADKGTKRVIPQLFKMKYKMHPLIWRDEANSSFAVAAALPDTELDIDATYWCVRLVEKHGLLLRKLDSGKFIRVGVFVMADTAWFDSGEPQVIHIV